MTVLVTARLLNCNEMVCKGSVDLCRDMSVSDQVFGYVPYVASFFWDDIMHCDATSPYAHSGA